MAAFVDGTLTVRPSEEGRLSRRTPSLSQDRRPITAIRYAPRLCAETPDPRHVFTAAERHFCQAGRAASPSAFWDTVGSVVCTSIRRYACDGFGAAVGAR